MVSEKRKQYLDDYVDTRKRISISLSASDFKKISYLAELNQTRPTSYISELVQHQLNKMPFIPQALTDKIKEMKFLLRNIATNINQITHRSNTLKVLVDERSLLLELQKLEEGITAHIHKEMNT
ncbi:MAG: plasmid mobilization relaxosome protein MobC [Colwellia sp.]